VVGDRQTLGEAGMDGFDVFTFDDHKVGHVVGRSGRFLVVEHGTVFKHRRPVPETFATVDEDARVVRLNISKEILESAPEVRDGDVDEAASADHYGLAGGYAAPETVGYGRIEDSETALSAEREELDRLGTSATEERAERLGRLEPGQGPDDRPMPSPGVTGGDRRRDAD
jgi:hypothetical protein